MARPTKKGLDYFPFDVDFFSNEKIEAIDGEFGSKGVLAVIYLLCMIYEKQYYMEWTKLIRAKIARRINGASIELIDQVVNRLVEWEFFDNDLFYSANILTSVNIQSIYFEAVKRRKEDRNLLYLLINVDINPSTNDINANINTTKKSKVKESKVKEINTPPIIPQGDGESSEDFLKFKDYLNRIAPRVEQMESPFTEFEYQQIKYVYCGDYVGYLVREMNNHKDLLSRNVSAFHTFQQWTTRRMADRKLYNKPITLDEFEGRQRLAKEREAARNLPQ